MRLFDAAALGIAAIPAIYYLLVLYSAARFFKTSAGSELPPREDFHAPCQLPQASIRGLDIDAYDNYASFCRQDYPRYEILFCIDEDDPALPIVKKLMADFPATRIRILYGSGRDAINDKVARLIRLVAEAEHDLLIITDGDVRVEPTYLRTVAAPFRDPKVGGATCLYVAAKETSFVERLNSIGMTSDFFAGIMVAWQVDGVKFTFGQTIAARRKNIENFGGYQTIENRPGDDLLVGRLIAEQGYEVKLLPLTVHAVADFGSLRDMFYKRVRWMTVMRRTAPWGHLGLLFTWGLPWALLAVAVHPTITVAAGYLGAYLFFRFAADLADPVFTVLKEKKVLKAECRSFPCGTQPHS